MDFWYLGQTLLYGLRNGLIYTIFASGLTLLFGVMGIVNMAHGGFYMIGVMTLYTFATLCGINFYVSILMAIAVMSLVGLIAQCMVVNPLLERKGAEMMILLSTIGANLMLGYGGAVIWGTDIAPIHFPYEKIIHLGKINVTSADLLLFLVGALIIVSFHYVLMKTDLGKKTRATSQSKSGARLVGINVGMVNYSTMIIATAMAGLAGILVAPMLGAYTNMGEPMLILGFVIVIVGGMGNLRGVVISGLGVGILEALFGQYVSEYYRMVFIYCIMIAVLLWRPEGLFAKR
jgi:branched-chain amino acid transport system permease protein